MFGNSSEGVFPIELIRDQKFSDVQVHFSRQLKQRTA